MPELHYVFSLGFNTTTLLICENAATGYSRYDDFKDATAASAPAALFRADPDHVAFKMLENNRHLSDEAIKAEFQKALAKLPRLVHAP